MLVVITINNNNDGINKDIFGFNDDGFNDSTYNDNGVVVGTAAVCGCDIIDDDDDDDDNNDDNRRLAVCSGIR